MPPDAKRDVMTLFFLNVEKDLISMEQGAKDTSLSIEDFKKAMIDARYQLPAKI